MFARSWAFTCGHGNEGKPISGCEGSRTRRPRKGKPKQQKLRRSGPSRGRHMIQAFAKARNYAAQPHRCAGSSRDSWTREASKAVARRPVPSHTRTARPSVQSFFAGICGFGVARSGSLCAGCCDGGFGESGAFGGSAGRFAGRPLYANKGAAARQAPRKLTRGQMAAVCAGADSQIIC
jgi:hypothetical protein